MAVLKCIIQFSMQTPPGINTEQNRVASVLNNGSIMPVVRVKFKAENGRVQEGNVLVDSVGLALNPLKNIVTAPLL